MFKRIDFQPGMRVLEVGCGTGEFWRAIQDLLPQEISITVADLSIGMVEESRSGLAGDLRFQFITLDAQQISLPGHSFDMILANHMLYHVPLMEVAIAEFRRVLKPMGKLCAATNGIGHLAELHQLIQTTGQLPIQAESALRFGLENGAGYLLGAFESVKRMDYLDGLWVTEAQPLMNYLQSMWWAASMPESQMAKLNEEILRRIQVDGGIKIRKSIGILLAEGYSTAQEGMV